MARPISKGFPYFNVDSDIFFSDRNIKALMGRFGTKGMCLYFYIMGEVYRDEGYFCHYDQQFTGCAASTLGITCGDVVKILDSLVELSLIDKELFHSKSIITSHGMQKRFQEMSRERGRKNEFSVDSDIWLLTDEETENYIHFSGKNHSYSRNNYDNSRNNPTKVKESKENKSKVKESSAPPDSHVKSYGEMGNVLLTDQEYEKIKKRFPYDYEERIDSLSIGMCSKGYNYKSHYAALLQWAEKEKREALTAMHKPKSKFHNMIERGYDFDEIEAENFAEIKEHLIEQGIYDEE